ncbi:hypothetical protein SFC76_13845 [Sphingomonas sp. CD22]|uniref:hypothetical protein n=1 Tax=Sphingomonas sp. CD22 TaxID=3100214 RepID=UPI002AE06010|nr:hypothetical protein [Sphingomonas sp. CD22]MEA1085344.1 hypothetical protein [Sphingomonas sp. CD22]
MDGSGTGDDEDTERLRGQDAKLQPLGQALRATYDADNHASLSKDVTGLMLDLAHVPFEPHEFQPLLGDSLRPTIPRGWLARARLALRSRAATRSR